MELESFGLTDVGRRRTKNEDQFLLDPPHGLYVVADGMGGHLGGEYASQLAVKTIGEVIAKLARGEEKKKNQNYQEWLDVAISQASLKIYEKSESDPKLKGMGTTTVAFLFREKKIFIANVGDSRAYRYRRGRLEQLTKDHSLLNEQIDAGLIHPKDAKDHRLKNIITRSVGFQEEVEADIEAKTVRYGDIYLLCSDGLYNMVSDKEILEVLSHHPLPDACRHLIDIGNARGGEDNITVVLTKVISQEMLEEEESTLKL